MHCGILVSRQGGRVIRVLRLDIMVSAPHSWDLYGPGSYRIFRIAPRQKPIAPPPTPHPPCRPRPWPLPQGYKCIGACILKPAETPSAVSDRHRGFLQPALKSDLADSHPFGFLAPEPPCYIEKRRIAPHLRRRYPKRGVRFGPSDSPDALLQSAEQRSERERAYGVQDGCKGRDM